MKGEIEYTCVVIVLSSSEYDLIQDLDPTDRTDDKGKIKTKEFSKGFHELVKIGQKKKISEIKSDIPVLEREEKIKVPIRVTVEVRSFLKGIGFGSPSIATRRLIYTILKRQHEKR